MNSSRTQFQGKTVLEWSTEVGLHPATIRSRLNRGQSWEEAITPIVTIESKSDELECILNRLDCYGNTVVRRNEAIRFVDQLQQAGYYLGEVRKEGYFIVSKGGMIDE